jgi:hypothetical protein
MAADEKSDEHLLQNLILADDDFPDLPHDFVLHLLEALDAGAEFGGVDGSYSS